MHLARRGIKPREYIYYEERDGDDASGMRTPHNEACASLMLFCFAW